MTRALTLFLRNPHLLWLTVAVSLVAGVAALAALPRLEDPRITNRNAIVVTPYPGASAARVEALVTEPLEDAVREVAEVKEVTATSRVGLSTLSIELQASVTKSNNREIFSRIRDKIDETAPEMPPGARAPLFDDERGAVAFTLLVAVTPPADHVGDPPMGVLTRHAEALADRLRNVAGTEIVRLYGDVTEEIAVELDRREAAQLGLSTRAVAERLAGADAKVPAGLLRTGGSELAVEVTGAFDGLQRIRDVPLSTNAGDAVRRLGDLATVTRGWRQPVDEIALTDGTRAVYVGARIQASTRVDQWATSARRAVDEARAAAGGAVDLRMIFDQSVYTEDRLGTLTSNLLLGAGVVMVVVFFAMGWRAAAVVATALPLTAALSLFGVLMTGGALHQMSIFGMIIALGLLIDNAIVMTDEVRKRLHAGHGRHEALAGALRHLAVPLAASTFTTVLGFLPIVLLPGNAGDFVGWIGGAVILALIASLFVSLTVVAALAARHLRVEAPSGRFAWLTEGITSRRWTAGLRATLRAAFRRPAMALAVAAIPSLTGFGLATQLGSEFFPPVDRDMADVKLWLPQHANIEATERAMRSVEDVIRGFEGVRHVHWLAGNSFPSVYYNLVMNRDDQANYAQGVIHTDSPAATERLVPEIQRAVDRTMPEAQVVLDKFGQGPPTQADVAYQLFGPDPDRLRDLGERVRAALQNHPDVLHTRMTLPRGQPKLWLHVDETEAANAGFTLAELARQFDANLEGATGGAVIEDLTRLPVRVRYAPEVRRDLAQVASTDFIASDGRFVPLASLGGLGLAPETPAVSRIDAERLNVIEGYPREGVLPIDVTNAVLDELDAKDFELPPGHRLEVAGEAEESDEATANLAAFAPVIATLMVATLILVFGSLRVFAILMTAAGLSVGLGLAGTWTIDFPVSFNTILGTIGLVGLAFNNSIVVIAAIRANPAARACDANAIAEEVLGTGRHLLSTTLTTIGGFTPLLLLTGGNFWPSLAVVLAGGVAGAMVLAIAFTPSLYILLHRREMRKEGGMTRTLSCALTAMALAGCTVGPEVAPPEPDAPARFISAERAADVQPVQADTAWWRWFDDPLLSRLIREAVDGNTDLAAARARVRAARALSRAASADDLPDIGASAGAERFQLSENGTGAAGALAEQGLVDRRGELYDAGLDANWEIDLFGRIRRREQGAEARAQAALERRRAVQLATVAEVARVYFELRGAQRRLQVARDNIRIQRETLELVRARLDTGLAPELEVHQADQQLARTRAGVPPQRAAVRANAFALARLTGRPPAALLNRLEDARPLPKTPVSVPPGLPSALLDRRPDVRTARAELKAATADVGVAVARLYPTLTVGAAGGVESGSIGTLLDPASVLWSFGPRVSWPIFQGGVLRADIDAAEAGLDAAAADYRGTVLTALTEVETALTRYREVRAEAWRLREAVKAARLQLRQARALYDRGLRDFLTVLDAERTLSDLEDRLAARETAVRIRLVTLYKALGGGWAAHPERS